MARDLKKTYVTSCSTYGLWFERFVIGMHKRMNDEVHQDQAVTLGVVHQLIEGLERDFIASKIEEEKDSLVDQAIFTLEDFLAALRGEEVLRLVWGKRGLILRRPEGIRSCLMYFYHFVGDSRERLGKHFTSWW